MTDGYDPKSCNALQRPFYRPVEAALRWCNLTEHEETVLKALGDEIVPRVGQFPQWPCLQANTEKILDAIEHGELTRGRDGRTVKPTERVNIQRLTVRHTDLRAWMLQHHPGSKPVFLFDEVERSVHSAINADTFRSLQADRDGLKARIEKATEIYKALRHDRDEIEAQRALLAAIVEKQSVPGQRTKATYLTIIGGLLELVRSPRQGRDSDAAVIRELVENYDDKSGISKTTLEMCFSEAKRQLKST
jgi:hypothetical protein